MEVKNNFKIIFDNNVIIQVQKDLTIHDTVFYQNFQYFVRNKIFTICYTNFSLVELAQANDVKEILAMYSIFSGLEVIHFYNHDTKKIEMSNKEEFLQRAFYKFFEFGNAESINALGLLLQESEKGTEIFEKYKDLRSKDFEELDKALTGDLVSRFHKNLNIHKGQYNEKSPHEAKIIFEKKYLEYYDSVKYFPEAADLPENIFSEEHYKKVFGMPFNEINFNLYKLTLIELFGYKQKKMSKVRSLNSLVDNYFVSVSHEFDFIITDDKDLKSKIEKFQVPCGVLSYSQFKTVVSKLMEKIKEMRAKNET